MKKSVRQLLLFVCIILCLGSGTFLIYQGIMKEKNSHIYDELQDTSVDTDTGSEEVTTEADPVEIPIDFAELKKVNDDIYAWIDIEDTKIHYPIVQHGADDNYYLNHTIEGKKGLPGSIYTQSLNERDFTDFNTVIYGHNMKNGTMFKNLHKFEDEEFFNSHETITIYTEDSIHTYMVYAALVYDDRHILYQYDINDAKDRLAFLQSLRDTKDWNKHIREDLVVDENSKLITLSTCIAGRPDNRFIVVGVEMDVKR